MSDRPAHAGYEVAAVVSGLAPRREVHLQAFIYRGRRLLHVRIDASPQRSAYANLSPDEAMQLASACFRWADRVGETWKAIEVESPDDDSPGDESRGQGDLWG